MTSVEEALDLISRAWTTPDDDDYCVFFPWIPAGLGVGEKRGKHWQESDAFRWPKDRRRILDHMAQHVGDDLFWTPVLYDGDRRVKEYVAENGCLYADLDEVDPRKIDVELRPTIAWRTSPGRYQALWILEGDIVGAADEGAENHRLTYLLGADKGGWDSTQVLRIPGWHNHKAEYRDEDGRSPLGKLLWADGPSYAVTAFKDLPEVLTHEDVEDVLDADIRQVDRLAVLARIKHRISARIKALIYAKDTGGVERNAVLWDIERSLADVGCTAAEIVAIIRETVWNKYRGRADELHRLKVEAAKAVAEVPEEVQESLESEDDRGHVEFIEDDVYEIPEPSWLVRGVWTAEDSGFIGGEPKRFKTYFVMDLGLSIVTGQPFLDHFPVDRTGPVIMVENEDPKRRIRRRFNEIIARKASDRHLDFPIWRENGKLYWQQGRREQERLPFHTFIRRGFIFRGDWLEWLQQEMERIEPVAVILDPFGRMTGDIEDKVGPLNDRVFNPLTELADTYSCSVIVLHHMRKSQGDRGGQRLLGSQAIHGFTESGIYLSRPKGEDVYMEIESKDEEEQYYWVKPMFTHKPRHPMNVWLPKVTPIGIEQPKTERGDSQKTEPKTEDRKRRSNKVEEFLRSHAGEEFTNSELADELNLGRGTVGNQLKRLKEAGKVKKVPDTGMWTWSEPN